MFKAATIFTIEFTEPTIVLEAPLSEFVACGPTQELSVGWAPPREAHGAMVEAVGGQLILKLAIETKSVPASELKRHLEARVERIEQVTGRKPGKKERRELTEEIKLDLLPAAFPKRVDILVWIDRENGLLVIDTATASRADRVISALVSAIPGVKIGHIESSNSPQALMASMLSDGASMGPRLFLGADCELAASDETNAKIRFANCDLDTDEIKGHIRQGKQVNRLGLVFSGRVSFVLDKAGRLRRLKLMDVVPDSKDESGFDADVTIMTGELTPLIDDLRRAMGGVFDENARDGGE